MTEAMTTKKPRKKKTLPQFSVELIDQLLAQVQNKDAESLLGENGSAGQLKKMLAERMLTAELNHHLANEAESGENHRNGSSSKTVLTPGGEIQLDVPRTVFPALSRSSLPSISGVWKALTTTSSACTPGA